MRLDTEFYKLPLHFDVKRLQQEIAQFTEEDWRPHPQGFKDNSALLLVSAFGSTEDDGLKGPMRPTPLLEKSPYLKQVLASFGTVIGRTRLMRLGGHAEAHAHMDANYYWHQRVRIHVPIVTDPEIQFHCGDKHLHMGEGECWIFNTWYMHNVINPTDLLRVHLVADTVGSAAFWDLVAQAEGPYKKGGGQKTTPRLVAFNENANAGFETETVNFPIVMSPWEQRDLLRIIFEDMEASDECPAQAVGKIKGFLERFHHKWHGLWARYGTAQEGWPAYRQALEEIKVNLAPFQRRKKPLKLPNGMEAIGMITQAIVNPALNPELSGSDAGLEMSRNLPQPFQRQAPQPGQAQPRGKGRGKPSGTLRLQRPVIIVAAPRSGSSFLFETLARSPGLYTIGGESHPVFEGIPKLNPANRDFDSNRLTAKDASDKIFEKVHLGFLNRARDRHGRPAHPQKPLRLLEKTPKNALRIPFLDKIFPDAFFIYLYREPEENIASIMEAWKSGKFVTYPRLPDWDGELQWSMLLIPKWRELNGKPLEEISAAQWAAANRTIIADLAKLPRERWCALNYKDLVADPQGQVERLCVLAGLAWDQDLQSEKLPLSQHTVSAPETGKWKKYEKEIGRVLPKVKAVAVKAAKAVAESLEQQSPSDKPSSIPKDPATDAKTSPLRSQHTKNLPKVLKEMGISLLVSTYQAGKLIVVREDNDKLNTHFRMFRKPMGMAADDKRMALGTNNAVQYFFNMKDAAKRLEPVGRHDAAFLQRTTHVTGNIDIHEMAWVGDELWIVNTKFCCLCTVDPAHNFVPRWRPPFITALAPEDRCHLNGLALRDGRLKYVTALGETDTPNGWRENKANGGIIMDIDTNEPVCRGLSMPHSPRWYANKLWVLESGNGSLATVDPENGELRTVVELPGFTRGLDFYGPLAFVGLSQIRETAAFGSLPITERLTDRICGVWVVNIKTEKVLGFLRFEGNVQEIFAVQVLQGIRFPDVIQTHDEVINNSFVLPKEALKDVPQVRAAAG